MSSIFIKIINTYNSANSFKLRKLLKRLNLTPKKKQKIIQEVQKDYSTGPVSIDLQDT